MIPLGSLTADQEIVNGTRTLAPLAGESGVGAGGVAACARPPSRASTTTDSNVSLRPIFRMDLPRRDFAGYYACCRRNGLPPRTAPPSRIMSSARWDSQV